MGLDGSLSTAFIFVSLEQRLELFAPALMKTGGFVGAEKSPIAVRLDALHEQVRAPESVEKITSADFFRTLNPDSTTSPSMQALTVFFLASRNSKISACQGSK